MKDFATHHQAIDGQTRIWRDDLGIPHVEASTDSDAFLALGYAHAQDRLWQMESSVRRGTGHWAEWVGPDGVPSDRLSRLMGSEKRALDDYANLGLDARSMLESYAIGVNTFIAEGKLPVEYEILATVPAKWQPWHSIVVMRQIGLLIGTMWMKLLRAAAIDKVGAAHISKLRYDDGGNDYPNFGELLESTEWLSFLKLLQPAIKELSNFASIALSAGGSNSWALSGKLTEHGRPLLMGDPHRELDVPAMYTQAHIKGATFDAIGLTVPGVPGFPHVAHNHHVAWCVTIACVDVQDLYVEKFRNGGREHLTGTGWQSTACRREIIEVRGGESVKLDCFTTRHGPVLIGDPVTGSGIAIRSGQFLDIDRSFDCLPRMLRARSVDALFEATRGWGFVDHNLVAADVDGDIGHRVRALVPDRPRTNGWLPMPGWVDDYEWSGIVPFESMPHSINPASGRIVTANNRLATGQQWPYIATDCAPPYRASRIASRLDELDVYSAKTMAPIFADDLSIPAGIIIGRTSSIPAEDLSPKAQGLSRLLASWDFHLDKTSVAATAYSHFRVTLTTLLAEVSGLKDASNAKRWEPHLGDRVLLNHLWWILPALLRENDEALLAGRSWTVLLVEALEVEASLDRRPQAWSEVHTPAPQHPLAKQFPALAPTLNPGCAPIGGDPDTVLATGYFAGDSLRATYSSLARYAFDIGDWQNSRWVVFQGVSGHASSEHRRDQNDCWAEVNTFPMVSDWTTITRTSQLDTQFDA